MARDASLGLDGTCGAQGSVVDRVLPSSVPQRCVQKASSFSSPSSAENIFLFPFEMACDGTVVLLPFSAGLAAAPTPRQHLLAGTLPRSRSAQPLLPAALGSAPALCPNPFIAEML